MIPYRLHFLVLLGIFLFNSTIFSQVYIGFKGGINQSKSTYIFNVDPALIVNTGDLYGFHFSVPLEIQVNDFFNFLPEVVVASEGSVLTVQVLEEIRTYNNAIIFAKLPLMGKLKLLKNKNYEFGVVAGIVPAFAVDVNSHYFASSDWGRSVDVAVDFEEAGIRRFDLGLSVGLNTEKVIAKGWKIMLDVRYNLGMLDIETHSDLTMTSESYSLTVGILTPLFKRNDLMNL